MDKRTEPKVQKLWAYSGCTPWSTLQCLLKQILGRRLSDWNLQTERFYVLMGKNLTKSSAPANMMSYSIIIIKWIIFGTYNFTFTWRRGWQFASALLYLMNALKDLLGEKLHTWMAHTSDCCIMCYPAYWYCIWWRDGQIVATVSRLKSCACRFHFTVDSRVGL